MLGELRKIDPNASAEDATVLLKVWNTDGCTKEPKEKIMQAVAYVRKMMAEDPNGPLKEKLFDKIGASGGKREFYVNMIEYTAKNAPDRKHGAELNLVVFDKIAELKKSAVKPAEPEKPAKDVFFSLKDKGAADAEKKAGKEAEMDYECPDCDAKVAKDAKICPDCGLEFEDEEEEKKGAPAKDDKGIGAGKQDAVKPTYGERVAQEHKEGVACACSGCNKYVLKDDKSCPHCGEAFEGTNDQATAKKLQLVKNTSTGEWAAPIPAQSAAHHLDEKLTREFLSSVLTSFTGAHDDDGIGKVKKTLVDAVKASGNPEEEQKFKIAKIEEGAERRRKVIETLYARSPKRSGTGAGQRGDEMLGAGEMAELEKPAKKVGFELKEKPEQEKPKEPADKESKEVEEFRNWAHVSFLGAYNGPKIEEAEMGLLDKVGSGKDSTRIKELKTLIVLEEAKLRRQHMNVTPKD